MSRSSMPTNGAPTARARHTANWTGSYMIVWGGAEGPQETSTATGGADTLLGGAGADTLDGGLGDDVFVYHAWRSDAIGGGPGRVLLTDRVQWSPAGPSLFGAPSSAPRPAP